jgi:hypothetical protein
MNAIEPDRLTEVGNRAVTILLADGRHNQHSGNGA